MSTKVTNRTETLCIPDLARVIGESHGNVLAICSPSDGGDVVIPLSGKKLLNVSG